MVGNYCSITNLFLHLLKHGSDHWNVFVCWIWWRGFWFLPTEAEEHKDEDNAHVNLKEKFCMYILKIIEMLFLLCKLPGFRRLQ